MSNFGYPAVDPVRDFERREAAQLDSEARRLSRLEGKAVDANGFTIRPNQAAREAYEAWLNDPQAQAAERSRNRKERLRAARFLNRIRAEDLERHLRLNREFCEAFDVPCELSMLTVRELLPEAWAAANRISE